jgi:PAS domain S-box-containing protein
MASAELQSLHESLAFPAGDSNELYRGLFEDAPVAYHEIDANGILVRVNRAECNLLGYRPEQLLGRPVWELVDAEEQANSREAVSRKLSGAIPLVPFERTYRRQDGNQVTLEIHENLLHDAAGKIVGIRTCLLDVTQRKRAEAALRRQAGELARSNAELEQFAYVASHDLQEPLRKIQAFGDRLKTRCGEALSVEGQDYLQRMQNAASRMQTLINDLLSYSRVSTNARAFAPVDLAEVARYVVSDLESRIDQVGATVSVEPLPVISGDKLQLSQLLQNLIGNALKFHKPGNAPRVAVRANVEPDPNGEGDVCRISVEDNGIGFDDKYTDRIFQLFQRLHGRNEYEGTGIGLAICRKIVRRHGGTITAHSTPGVGSRFIVTLPVNGQGEKSQ